MAPDAWRFLWELPNTEENDAITMNRQAYHYRTVLVFWVSPSQSTDLLNAGLNSCLTSTSYPRILHGICSAIIPSLSDYRAPL